MTEQIKTKTEEMVLRSTLAQRPPLPSSPPPTLQLCSTEEAMAKESAVNDSNSAEMIKSASSSSINKFERKSPSPTLNGTTPVCILFEELPLEVLSHIFLTLDLKDRIRTSKVCKKWHKFLTDGRLPLEDIVVINLFEPQVFKSMASQSTRERFSPMCMPDVNNLRTMFAHCPKANSVKIWYTTLQFAENALRIISECKVQMRCVDIYPYTADVGIDLFHHYLPHLPGITMRPHGNDFFFDGLPLYDFPQFSRLDTLYIDSFNLGKNVELPPSITSLEWSNRNCEVFKDFIPKLAKLKRLEYLSVAHAEPAKEELSDFLTAIDSSQLNSLRYLSFKFVKFENSYLSWPRIFLDHLRFLKFDLCYGNLPLVIGNFLQRTNKNLKFISLNIISDEENVFRPLYEDIATRLYEKSIALHLGLLQRNNPPSTGETEKTSKPTTDICPTTRQFCLILSKFDASFVSDTPLLQNIFVGPKYPFLTEIKFVQCQGLTNDILGLVSLTCLRLKKLSILSCRECSETGLLYFIHSFQTRLSLTLEIVWKGDKNRSNPINLYLKLKTDSAKVLNGRRILCKTKQFPKGHAGQCVVIWEDTKVLRIQDYDDFDRYRILGVVLGEERKESSPSTSARAEEEIRRLQISSKS